MLGGIIAVLLCVWFYRTAEAMKLNPLPWIVGALVVYYGVKYGWTWGVVKPTMGDKAGARTMMATLMTDYSGAVLGAIAAAVFRAKVLLRQNRDE